jgi:hypothetical protein
MDRFALDNRKVSSYISKNELSAVSNRIISAYFTLTNDLIVNKTSYLQVKTFKPRFLLMTSLSYFIIILFWFVTNVLSRFNVSLHHLVTRLSSILTGYSLLWLN